MIETNRLDMWRKVLLSLFIMLGCFVLAQLFVLGVFSSSPAGITASMYNADIDSLSQIQLLWLKALQSIAAIIVFILPAILIARFVFRNTQETLKLNYWGKPTTYLFIVFALFASMPWMNVVITWNANIELPTAIESVFRGMEENGEHSIELMLSGNTWGSLLLNLILIALIPAIGEELFFRGIIQGIIQKYTRNAHVAVIASAIIFSAIHFQFYGFIPRMLLGAFFGYLVVYTQSLGPAIWAHFINNAMGVTAHFMAKKGVIDQNIDELGTQANDLYYVFISLLLSGIIIYYLFRKTEREL